LLKALGVPKNGLPLHIYRMREHGYPSGWLEEAREEYSGIAIYTTPNECNYKCLLLYNTIAVIIYSSYKWSIFYIFLELKNITI